MMSSFSKKLVLPVFAALTFAGCSSEDKMNVEIVQDMMKTPALKPQSYDEGAPNHSAMRIPPENTVPVGFVPYKYGTNVELASKELKNPFAGVETPEVLSVGVKYYETNCAVCHGHKGEGGEAAHSTVSGLMALKPPSLLSDKVRTMTDGHLYHIITMGQGVMGPYASHISQANRWQVVTYIRQLQKKAGK